MKRARKLEITDAGMEDGCTVYLEIRSGRQSTIEKTVLEEFVIKPGKHHLDFYRFRKAQGGKVRRLRVIFYGMLWRCWDSKPTVEQMKAEEWFI